MINRVLNVCTGIIGVLYILVDIVFHLTVWGLIKFKRVSYPLAFRLADNKSLFFSIILILTFIMSLLSLIALISNLILFVRADFILRVVLTTSGFFLPFVHGEATLSLCFEVFFISLFLIYLYKISHRKQDISDSEFENYKQM
ncbi:hypothetical protein [Ligilactobacillus acidipiscis]|uniref:hypothetical protein n=1 Tax=Ligilactobacillus acidipiscis TaxID=89059 RepID=UPI0023F84588|nr:hypothetical protein [Ligilactobacillus acidipiscis]WEV55861.1 hypothetical protein OZX66_06260 [Ligilactobacillus acidipiscis]